MDGIDGLVASSMFIVFLTISLNTGILYIPITGALLGFLFWNWHPAKVFMGDSGSTFLGAIFIATLLKTNSIVLTLKYIFLLTPLIADSSICLLRRLLSNQNIFLPHKKHLYQRLHQAGWSHKKVSSLYSLATLILCISFFFFNIHTLLLTSLLIILFGTWLDKKFALKFK